MPVIQIYTNEGAARYFGTNMTISIDLSTRSPSLKTYEKLFKKLGLKTKGEWRSIWGGKEISAYGI